MPTISLQDLSNRIYGRLDNNTALYTQAEVTSAVNETIKILNLLTGFQQSTVQIPGFSVANRHFYDVPSSILIPLRLQFENTFMTPYAPNEIGRSYPTWLTDTTGTLGQPVQRWVPLGLRKFAIHPADAVGGNDLRLTGVIEPPPLVNLADVANFPNEVLNCFDYLAAHQLTLKEGGQIFSDMSADYQRFIRAVKQITIWKSMVMPSWWVPEAQQKK